MDVCFFCFFWGGDTYNCFFVVNRPTPHRSESREQPPILVLMFVWLGFLWGFFLGGDTYIHFFVVNRPTPH